MRKSVHELLTKGRVRIGSMGGTELNGLNGAFFVPGPFGVLLRVVASTADADRAITNGWEHVSVSTEKRCPNWPEMCYIKDLFWEPEEMVVQLHPPKSEWISNHPYCLHMWRHETIKFPQPPSIMVGVKALGELEQK